jgi:hypothetical protein
VLELARSRAGRCLPSAQYSQALEDGYYKGNVGMADYVFLLSFSAVGLLVR